VANPVPTEAALEPDVVGEAIERSLSAARDAGVRGKEVTPFLLARLADETEGRSVTANRALVVSNADVAARFASALASSPPLA
jgi:pseudouridine-5'-phosphate glycosidase